MDTRTGVSSSLEFSLAAATAATAAIGSTSGLFGTALVALLILDERQRTRGTVLLLIYMYIYTEYIYICTFIYVYMCIHLSPYPSVYFGSVPTCCTRKAEYALKSACYIAPNLIVRITHHSVNCSRYVFVLVPGKAFIPC